MDHNQAAQFVRDYVKAAGFLDTEYVTLSAIDPSGANRIASWGCRVDCLARDDEFQLLADWIAKHNGTRNLYFQPNPLSVEVKGFTKRASTEHLSRVVAQYVDLDLTEYRDAQRIARQIDRLLQPASVLIHSGNGYQVIYFRAEPLDVRPWTTDCKVNLDAASHLNRQLVSMYHGDPAATDAVRLLRLPFTINIPNAKKRKAGRVECESRLIALDGHRYQPPDLLPDPALCELLRPYKVTGRELYLVQDGTGDHEGPSECRAELLGTGLLRRAIPDDVLHALCFDPRWGLSVKFREQGEKWYEQEIARLREKFAQEGPPPSDGTDLSAVVDVYNADYFLVGVKSKVYIGSFENTEFEMGEGSHRVVMRRRDLLMRTEAEQRLWTKDQNVVVNKKKVPIYEIWSTDPRRRKYRSVGFYPTLEPEVNGSLNLFTGFAIKDGDPRDAGARDVILDHVHMILANRDDAVANWLLDLSAAIFQHPGRPAEVATLFYGPPGAGKSSYWEMLVRLVGRHSFVCGTLNQAFHKFNAHMTDSVLILIQEARWRTQANESLEARLMDAITAKDLAVEGKGLPIINVRNVTTYLLCSNYLDALKIVDRDRRIAPFEVSSARVNDADYFTRLWTAANNGGLASLYDYLLAREIKSFHYGQPFETDLKWQMMELGWDDVRRNLKDALDRGSLATTHYDDTKWHRKATTRGLRDALTDGVRYPPTLKAVVDMVCHLTGAERRREKEYLNGSSTVVKKVLDIVAFPPLAEARATFSKVTGWRGHWPEPDRTDEELYTPFTGISEGGAPF